MREPDVLGLVDRYVLCYWPLASHVHLNTRLEACSHEAGYQEPGKDGCTQHDVLTIAEIREDAQAKGLKTAEAYGKGCKSLAACPVTYERPRDLICLTGIGPKTVALLEKRWRAWCMETGRPIDATPDSESGPFL